MSLTGIQLLEIGFSPGPALGAALKALSNLPSYYPEYLLGARLADLLATPAKYADDETWGATAALLAVPKKAEPIALRTNPYKYQVFGDNIEQGAIDQMNVAMRLPISHYGSLNADGHQGYGLPIGGVLATKNAVIPYGVGVDIGCRLSISILDTGIDLVEKSGNYQQKQERLRDLLLAHTRFGDQREHEKPSDAAVLHSKLFSEIPVLKRMHETARLQLGTSGGGNHFVEFGFLYVDKDNVLGVAEGNYPALLTHSGSRGLGANIADYYTKLAVQQRVMPKEAQNLAWLDMDTEAGQEYWLAMNLAGEYADACHRDIHQRLHAALGSTVTSYVTNAHNLAWKETHFGQEFIVHRKGATPAGKGVAGIIPGSMATPAYLVRGLGSELGLQSASHGAGRAMSRSVAKQQITQADMDAFLAKHGVLLTGGGLDEAPQAYKDISTVMSSQQELVAHDGIFFPRVVRMAPPEADKPWQRGKKPLGE
jgi:tRNA-splicing ligase RtcB